MNHSVGPEAKPFRASFIENLPLAPRKPAIGLAAACGLSLLALWLRWEIDPVFPPGYPYLTFFPAVILTSFLFGVRAGILAAVLCGGFAWYFFIPPRLSFAILPGTITTLLFYAGVVAIDIGLVHLMQRANGRLHAAREEVRKLAEERGQLVERTQVLFQEVQHRVGNNLQMVGAVLALQLRSLSEPTARQAIADASARLTVIGRIQRQLYSPDGRLVALDGFVRQVAQAVMTASARHGIACGVTAHEQIEVGPESAVPIALILSEAITNALEHAMDGGAEDAIAVDVQRQGERVVLEVRDFGRGLPAGFDADRVDSIGLRISRVLADQLQAEYTLEDARPGTRMRLSMPAAGLVRSTA